MTTTRVNGRDMVLLLDGLDRSDELTSSSLAYGSRQTFAEMRGSKPKRLDGTVTQDLSATSLYRIAMSGDTTPLTGVFKPLGNAAPSPTQPHYTFMVTPGGISGDTYMGGDAADDPSKALTVAIQWLITDWTEVTS